jgi:Ca-activated chloride channel homolog
MISELWDQLDPGFFEPIWLLVGLATVVVIVLLEIGAFRRRRVAVRLFAASHLVAALTATVSPVKRYLKRFLFISATALLFIAMARPHLFDAWQEENRTGFDLLIAVDCSKSMLTEDVKPNRLERAKLSIADFADRLPDNRLGLIAFAGDAFLQCPLTLDHDAFQAAVRELDTNSIPRPGTDIATAIDEAVDAFKSQPNNLKILLLVTDGEDLEGRALDAAKNAAQAGLKIYTIGVGTPNGGLIPEPDENGDTSAGTYHRDASGQVVQSKLDEDMLNQIASATGGAYVQLGQRGEGLQQIYDRYIAPLPRQHFEERREKLPIERFEWPLTLAILLFVCEFLINERYEIPTAPIPSGMIRRPRRRTARSALGALPLAALGILLTSAPVHAASTDTAESDYKSGKYEDALENYKRAIQNQPDRNDLEFNRGDAAYRAGKFNEAEEAFRKSLDTPDLGLQENAYYNLGNAQFKHGEALQKVDPDKTMGLWEQALKSYDSSLKLRSTADAHHNYDIVKKRLDELKQQQQQKQDKSGPSKSDKDDKSDKPSPQNNGNGQGSQGDKSQQGQPGQNNPNPQNSQNQSQSQPQGDKPQGDKPQQGQDKPSDGNNKGDSPSNSSGQDQNNMRTYSGTRAQDKEDPGIKSREEAEALLDSLKDDERHITAQTLNNNNPTPPPASGKDW